MRKLFFWFCLIAGLALLVGEAPAQSYPDRPIKMFVGFGPGSSTDISARLVAKSMEEKVGQPVVVENRPGAGGTIAASAAAAAPKDGYTLLWTPSSVTVFQELYSLKTFAAEKDLHPIGGAAAGTLVMIVRNDPSITLNELIARAKTKPNAVTFASGGVGSNAHLATIVLGKAVGAEFLHVPYKSSTAATTDLLAGQVDFLFDALAASLPFIKSGHVKALGVSAGQRSSFLPDVPTIAEAGVPGYEHSFWLGVSAPVGTPKPVVDKLSDVLFAIVSAPSFRADIGKVGMEPFPIRSAELQSRIAAETQLWKKKLAGVNFKPE